MMSHQKNEETTMESNLLTPQENDICKKIAGGETPHSQRAIALLALNERSTQAEAAEQAGLTIGQVKYWVGKFRRQHLYIFPETLVVEPGAEDEEEKVTKIDEEPESVTEQPDSSEDKKKEKKKIKKAKKEKQGKREKKTKKTKKDKKAKKTKESKKKARKTIKGKKSKKTKKTKKGKKD